MIPPDAELTERPEEIPAWDDMPDDLKPVLARQMEVYAGFLEHTDHHVGRLVDALEDLEILDDTLIYYIIGDNGASAEGTPNGSFNEIITLNGAAAIETTEFMASRIDEFGTPDAYNHYAVGWAHAMDTPYQWTKQVASHWGGTRNGTIVHWPNGIKARGEMRSQFRHVIDVAATVLDAAGLPAADVRARRPADAAARRRAWRTRFDDAGRRSAERRSTSRCSCNRGIYHQGWTAVTRHSIPWVRRPRCLPFDDDVWELYAADDWTQAHDLAAEQPEKLAELQRLFLIEAGKYNVLPLDDRRFERFNADLAGRPQLITGNSQLLFGGMGRLTENSILVIEEQVARRDGADRRARRAARGRDHRPGRRVRRLEPLPARGQAGLLLQLLRPPAASRSTATGRSRPASTRCAWSSPTTAAASARAATCAVRRRRQGRRGPGRGDRADGLLRRRDHRPRAATAPRRSATTTAAGQRLHRPVQWVQIDIDEAAEDLDHLITPEERLRVAMARQ